MSQPTSSSISAAEANLLRVEAARYALLRRVAFAIRHQLVMHLQPIGMVSEVLERRLRAPQPDMAQVNDGVTKINSYSKAAVHACLDVITWMAPEPGATVPLEAGVHEIMDLLRSSLSFRGFNLQNEAKGIAQPVGRAAMRVLLPAALLALTDDGQAPADLTMSAEPGEDVVVLRLRLVAKEGEAPSMGELQYRPLKWDEVVAMARSEDVEAERTDTGCTLTFPVVE